MLVRRSDLPWVLGRLRESKKLALDTETTGLRPWHDDRLFSIIIADGPNSDSDAFYFNFQAYPGLDADCVLAPFHMKEISPILSGDRRIFMHNAKFDLAFLHKEGLEVTSEVHCTKAQGRVVYNDHMSYSLADSLKRIDLEKDDAVEKYILENGLWKWVDIPGKSVRFKDKFYDQVPFDIIVPYGCMDASGTFSLGVSQEKEIEKAVNETPHTLPNLLHVSRNETRLTDTIFRMEKLGCRISRDYCLRASRYETDRAGKAQEEFRRHTGKDFKTSGKLFSEVFGSERHKWAFTKKGNPSFESEVLATFENPAAKSVLEYRDAKSKSDFYNSFLWHADSNDIVHPGFHPDQTIHGRFSSSDPNLQNLTSEEGEEEKEFIVRRAIIPRPGFVFIMPDYSAMEYRFMLEFIARYVGRTFALLDAVNNGEDVHQATANNAKKLTGLEISRKDAKMTNFLTIYGGGNQKLADGLGITLDKAKAIRTAVLDSTPEMRLFVRQIITTAETRGYIFNWLGRRCYFPNPEFAYKGPNYFIAGGCADVMKVAMNNIDAYLLDKKSRMVLTIHDELAVEVHESEIDEVPQMVKYFMEEAFPSKYLKLTTDMEWSPVSLGDKRKGFPNEARDKVS